MTEIAPISELPSIISTIIGSVPQEKHDSSKITGLLTDTACPTILCPFYRVSYYTQWDMTLTDSIARLWEERFGHQQYILYNKFIAQQIEL